MDHLYRLINQPALAAVLMSLVFLLTACEPQEEKVQPAPPTPAPDEAPKAATDPALVNATEEVWQQGTRVLSDTQEQLQGLSDAVAQLLADPSEHTLGGARLAWHHSHDSYQDMAVFVALAQSNPGLFGSLLELDFSIDAWPIQPGFLDYYGVYSHSGIVNDIAVPLTAKALREQHGLTDDGDVALGFHALEYLLWGEAGERPAEDFKGIEQLTPDQKTAGLRLVDLPPNRRRVLLELSVRLLQDDVAKLREAWSEPTAQLRRRYLSLQPPSRLQLLQAAGFQWTTENHSRLQAMVENAADGEGETDATEPAPVHNAFAGHNARLLAHQLGALDRLLLDPETGLGQWTMEPEPRQQLRDRVQSLNESLLNWREQPWPPTDEAQTNLLTLLASLAELLEPPATP